MTKNNKSIDEQTLLFGLKIFSSKKIRLLEILKNQLSRGTQTLSVFTPNPEQIVLASHDKIFASYLGFASLLIPDGIGLVLSSKILALFGKSSALRERITGVDIATDLLKVIKKDNLSALILGGRKYDSGKVAGLTVHSARKKVSGTQPVLYWHEGFLNISVPTQAELQQLEKILLSLKPSVVFVAFGAPYQEKWVVENSALLDKSKVKVVVVVGGTFDMLFGKVGRAPKWMQYLGLEWLYRLVQEPWRWRRQLQLFEFIKLSIKELLK